MADDLSGALTTWTDPEPEAGAFTSPCYVVESTFVASGTHSQHSPPFCWWGPGASRITTVDASSLNAVGGQGSTNHGRFHYENWGDDGHSLTLVSFTPTQSGPHLIQATFGNGAGGITTGVTCAVKRVRVEEVAGGAVVGTGVLLMPHLGEWSRWEDSSFVRADLSAGTEYRIVIRGDDDMVNMSSFAHFELYTGGLGGRDGVFNRVNISELKILAL